MKPEINWRCFAHGLSVLLAVPVLAVASAALAQCPPRFTQDFDGVTPPALPADWVASQGVNVTGAPLWVTSTFESHTPPNDAFSTAPDNVLDNRLDTPVFTADPFGHSISFQNLYNLESGLDGAVLEISSPNINGGAFTDITDPAVGGSFSAGGYNMVISTAFQSPIAGRMAWSGNSGGYIFTQAFLGNAAFPPSQVKVRFRLASDNSGASPGWRIDTFSQLSNECSSPAPTATATVPPTPTPTATPSATVTPTPTATASPTATPSPGSPTPCTTNVIVDGSFENGGIPSSTWDPETSTNFGTPLCDFASCGNGAGESPPRTGLVWLWFGGISAPETATLGQTATIPAGDFATLHFWMRVGTVTAPFTDVVNVRVDGAIVQSFLEPAVAEANYTERVIDLSAFADGAAHALLFEYIGPSSEISSFVIDDVTLLGPAPGCPSPSPTVPPPPSPTPAPPTPSPTATPPPPPAQALNISTRLRVETGERVAIGGFIVTGIAPKRVALRGLGPSLGSSGLSDVLADPTLELRGSDGTLLLQNDNWQDDPFGGGGAELVALGLAPQNPNESGIVATLEPGAYTAVLAGKNQTSGLGLVEIYDVDTAADSQLANISTRGYVRTADNAMIGGFILAQGSASVDVAVRGIGPSLGQSGLTDVLADPTLELHDGNGTLLITNDNWQDDPVSAAQLTLHGLAPSNSLEAGVFITLPPGLFTAVLSGKNGGVGLGLVEVYVDVRALIVTSTADSGAGSLRDALAAAEDGDTIQFAALNGQTISLTTAELVIDKDITIRGPGRDALAVSKASTSTPYFGIFHVLPGHTVVIEGLTISHAQGVQGGHYYGVGIVNDHATLTLKDSTVCCNYGGGIRSYGSDATMAIVNSMVTGNFLEATPGIVAVGAGGGAGVSNYGTLTISRSIVSGNFIGASPSNPAPPLAGGDGGGIFNGGLLRMSDSTVSANVANRWGGGIDNRGTAEITASTISGNHAQFYGGGVSNSGEYSPVGQATLTISNSTVYGNSVSYKEFSVGGGVYNAGPLTITHSTISANRADGEGGGIMNHGPLQIGNSILSTGIPGPNVVSQSENFTSLGYNLSDDDGGGLFTATGDQINTDPILGPLQDNGGPTFTLALLTGSPAINAGDPTFAPPPLDDQRGPGFDRVVGGRIDIGSFEVQP